MLLKILLLGLVFCLTDAKSSPQQDLEDLVEKLESRLRDMETRFQDEKKKLELKLEEMEMEMKHEKDKQANEKKELEEKIAKMETRLMEEFKDKMKQERDELEKNMMELEASTAKLRLEVEEESLRKENTSNNALTNPSLRDLPIVIISAYQGSILQSPQTVTFDSFLANYNNAASPGGGYGVLDLDSGVFSCFTPGYYTVSFSAYAHVDKAQILYLYKNKTELAESVWYFESFSGDLDVNVAVTGSRIVVSNLWDILHESCQIQKKKNSFRFSTWTREIPWS